jgi:uncharacterized protein (TIGR02996 family)
VDSLAVEPNSGATVTALGDRVWRTKKVAMPPAATPVLKLRRQSNPCLTPFQPPHTMRTMNQNPVNPALEAAVIANAEDDTPRLVYADWLDENGDPDRAAFIRTQCALWNKDPADEDYVDLMELRWELAIRIKPSRAEWLAPQCDLRLLTVSGMLSYVDRGIHSPVERGFPYLASMKGEYDEEFPARARAQELRDYLPELFRTTTIRGFRFGLPMTRHLGAILGSAAASELSSLAFQNVSQHTGGAIKALVGSGAIQSLKRLELSHIETEEDAVAFANTSMPQLHMLHGLTGLAIRCPTSPLKQLLASSTFSRLTDASIHFDPSIADVGWAGIAELPRLHTLDVASFYGAKPAELGRARWFPYLVRLKGSSGPLTVAGAETMAALSMPRLKWLELYDNKIGNDELRHLAKSSLFEQLCVLSLSRQAIGDRGVAMIASSPCAKQLRQLRLGDNAFGKSGLNLIAKEGTFPSLTTLDLRSSRKQKASSTEMAAFLRSFSIPCLKHLSLHGWEVGDEGAKALAENPAFANLTWLDLYRTRIGDAGLRALANSPYLRGLIHLDVNENPCRWDLDELRKIGAFPAILSRWDS